MSKDELIAFLRDNLTINVKVESHYKYGGGYRDDQIVQLKLCDEVISEATIETVDL